MGHLLGYARVSTADQQPQLQVDALQRAGCYRVFTETASGARTDRPVLEQVLDQHHPRQVISLHGSRTQKFDAMGGHKAKLRSCASAGDVSLTLRQSTVAGNRPSGWRWVDVAVERGGDQRAAPSVTPRPL